MLQNRHPETTRIGRIKAQLDVKDFTNNNFRLGFPRSALVFIHKCSSTPHSHVLRGNAGLDALRPAYATLPVTRGAARLDGIPTRRVGMRIIAVQISRARPAPTECRCA